MYALTVIAHNGGCTQFWLISKKLWNTFIKSPSNILTSKMSHQLDIALTSGESISFRGLIEFGIYILENDVKIIDEAELTTDVA